MTKNEIIAKYGGKPHHWKRHKNKSDAKGGWVHKDARVSQNVTHIAENVVIRDGTFNGGIFRGGTFYGGTFCGGIFRGGTFNGGIFNGGTFCGGTFNGGTFYGGTFNGGIFYGGTFYGGTFYGGTFKKAPTQVTRSDGYVFTAKIVEGELRIWAGCRDFNWNQAIEHWGDPMHHAHKESMRIINFLREQELDNG